MSGQGGGTQKRAYGSVQSPALAASVRRAWTETPPQPMPGQVWRARWGDHRCLVMIVDAPVRAARIVALTTDVAEADDTAVVLPAGENDLGVSLVAWVGDMAVVPLRVLDRFVGGVLSSLDEHSVRGHVVLSVSDDRVVLRARLQDTLHMFEQARWAPEQTGSLADLLGDTDRRSLAGLLDVAPREAIALLRGQRALTIEQAQFVASHVGRGLDDVLATNPVLPEALVADLDLPKYRAQVGSLASLRRISEIEAWRVAAYAVAGVSQRRTDGQETTWRDRLDQYFQVALDES